MLLLKSKAGVRCPKRTIDAAKYNANVGDVLKYFNDISCLAAQRAKIYELVLFNNIFVQLF